MFIRKLTQVVVLMTATIAVVKAKTGEHQLANDSDSNDDASAYDVAFTRVGDNEDQGRSFAEICERAGFQFEEHRVITQDGYILAVYRIPGLLSEKKEDLAGESDSDFSEKERQSQSEKPAIYFQHGILDSSYAWVMHYSDKSPAFVAARAGYDVWMNNSRGNTYSRRHTVFDPDQDKHKFWHFGWQDMGKYDVPAVIDHILENKEEQKKVAYIGHSQGSTQMYYALAEGVPGLADKLSIFVALGTATKLSHAYSINFKRQIYAYKYLDTFLEMIGIHEMFNNSWKMPYGTMFCHWFPDACNIFYMETVNLHPELNDDDRFNVYSYGHFPHGAPVQSWRHYCQNVIEDRFQEYIPDYSKDNHESKEIPLEKISERGVPVAIFGGKDDELADWRDAEWTRDSIGDAVVHYELIEGGHISFLVGHDMSYFTDGVMGLLAEHHPVTLAQEAKDKKHLLDSLVTAI